MASCLFGTNFKSLPSLTAFDDLRDATAFGWFQHPSVFLHAYLIKNPFLMTNYEFN